MGMQSLRRTVFIPNDLLELLPIFQPRPGVWSLRSEARQGFSLRARTAKKRANGQSSRLSILASTPPRSSIHHRETYPIDEDFRRAMGATLRALSPISSCAWRAAVRDGLAAKQLIANPTTEFATHVETINANAVRSEGLDPGPVRRI